MGRRPQGRKRRSRRAPAAAAAGHSAAKPAAVPRAAAKPASPGAPTASLDALTRDLCRRLADSAVEPGTLSPEALQDLMAAVIRAYVRRAEAREAGEVLPPIRPAAPVTPTEVVVLVTELMKAADVELFELSMWQAFGKI